MVNSKNTFTFYWKMILVLTMVSGLFFVPVVQAQDEISNTVTIHQLNAENFPQISFFLEAKDELGRSINDLTEFDVQVREDDLDPLPVDLVARNEPGFQVILAYNLAPGLANITNDGISRYQAITNHILDWLDSRPVNTPDDFSLTTDTGLQEIRREDPREFAEELAAYAPDLANSQPNLTSLLQALDLATDPNPNPLMKRAILYITTQPNLSSISAIPGLIDRAIQQNVAVFVWMAGPATARSSNPSVVEPMVELAELTGGQFFLFSGQEELPDLEEYFSPQRHIYQVTYSSKIKESGFHRIEALVNYQDQDIISNQETIRLIIQPPIPILINPPLLIERNWDVDPLDSRIRALSPDQVEIRYLYLFSDDFPRDIAFARLVIEDEIVQEFDTPPFGNFILDLTPYESDQELLFYVEIEDELGIRAQTEPTIIDITIEPVPLTFWEGLLRLELTPERWIILASILTAGMVLILALVFVGKKQAFWREQAKARKRQIDPVTQPVKINQDGLRKSKSESGRRLASKEVEAMLVPVNDQFEPDRKRTVVLDKKEWVIGSDEKNARLVIKNAALDSMHARLKRRTEGDFWLSDQNSIAGTWVNFTPITSKGVKLKHGDLIHFAKASYRFELSHPTEDSEIQIITYNQNYDS